MDDGRLTSPRTARALLLLVPLISTSALSGCAVAGGPMTGVMTEKGSVNLGGKLNAHLYPSEIAGPIIGVEGQVASTANGPCPCSQWRSLAEVGYGSPPTAVSSAIGEELLLVGGLGRMPDDKGHVGLAGLAGMQLAVPIRFARRRELWQADDYVGTKLELVPDVTMLLDVPTSGAASNVEVSVGLALRGYIYSAVLP